MLYVSDSTRFRLSGLFSLRVIGVRKLCFIYDGEAVEWTPATTITATYTTKKVFPIFNPPQPSLGFLPHPVIQKREKGCDAVFILLRGDFLSVQLHMNCGDV